MSPEALTRRDCGMTLAECNCRAGPADPNRSPICPRRNTDSSAHAYGIEKQSRTLRSGNMRRLVGATRPSVRSSRACSPASTLGEPATAT